VRAMHIRYTSLAVGVAESTDESHISLKVRP
jgi:hypothetical protein